MGESIKVSTNSVSGEMRATNADARGLYPLEESFVVFYALRLSLELG